MELHHVGVATSDADEMADLYVDLLGCPIAHEETFDGLRIRFLTVGDAYLELLEPVGEGTIADYLDDRGPGIHHVAFVTDDLVGTLDTARELGIELVDENPRTGAWGHEVAFLHPRSTGGVLVEFVQP